MTILLFAMDKINYYYVRGVAPKEVEGSLQGIDGRVTNNSVMHRRGDKTKYVFGLNEVGIGGFNNAVFNEVFETASFYANAGAWTEYFQINDKITAPYIRGYLLFYGIESSLEKSDYHEDTYGKAWRITSILPSENEKNLIGISLAPPQRGQYHTILPHKDGEFCILGPNHPAYNSTIEQLAEDFKKLAGFRIDYEELERLRRERIIEV